MDKFIASANDFFLNEELKHRKETYELDRKAWKAAQPRVVNKPLPFDVNWADVAKQLPTSKTDDDEKQQRAALWTIFDANGNGYVSLAEADKGIRDGIDNKELFKAKPAILRAFQFAKNYSKTQINDKYGPDYISKQEFRIFLVALKQRF